MKYLNCTVVFNEEKNKILFCKRSKEPYKGLYNFVGGKVEEGEIHLLAAYRELEEETGITEDDICLFHLMDFTYYEQDFVLEIYLGKLQRTVKLVEEINPLIWMPLTDDFTDSEKYAGEQNIAHIINVALKYPIESRVALHESRIDNKCYAVGIDGCKGGWIAASVCKGRLNLYRYKSLEEIIGEHQFDTCLIDMVIGLQGNREQVRPDVFARSILKGRASTVFPAPCRRAVYGETKEERINANIDVLQKKFSSQTDAIIPKIREVDEFLQLNTEYKNLIRESHPEVCFARLNGGVVMTSKHDDEGIHERIDILSNYFPFITRDWTVLQSKRLKCNEDDLVDSICLAIVANMISQGRTETIPEEPMKDDTGLYMQMVIPKEKQYEQEDNNGKYSN